MYKFLFLSLVNNMNIFCKTNRGKKLPYVSLTLLIYLLNKEFFKYSKTNTKKYNLDINNVQSTLVNKL